MKSRNKLGQFIKGHSVLKKWKLKSSKSSKGKHYSFNTEFKKGHFFGKRFKKGDKPWNKDIPMTDNMKKRISLTKTGKPRGGNPLNWKHSEETKIKLLKLSRNQQKEGTLPEKLFEQELKINNFNYKKQVLLVNKTIPDFYLPETKTAIYVDGDYWHTKDKNIMIRDYGINKYLIKCGYNVFRFWEFEIKDVDIRKQLINCFN